VFLVGEAPGFREDDIGKPFAGRAGKVLDVVIEECGLTRKDVYISNVVHCRPPDNRKPTAEEIAVCRKYLLKEIALVKPKLIIGMGQTAMFGLVKDLPKKATISMNRGKFQVGPFKIPTMLTFHPAYGLRNPHIVATIISDFKRGLNLDERKGTVTHRVTEKNFDHFVDLLEQSEEMAVDVETTGLSSFNHRLKLLMAGFSVQEGESWVACRDILKIKEHRVKIKQAMTGKLLVNQNIKFDLHWLKRCQLLPRKGLRVWCTMIAYHLIDENSYDKRLETLATTYAGMEPWKITHEEFREKGYPLDEMVPYCGKDVDAALRLKRIFSKMHVEQDLTMIMAHMMRVCVMMADAEWDGIMMDWEAIPVLGEHLRKQIKKLGHKMRRITRKYGELPVIEGKGSAKWKEHFLFDVLKLPVLARTKKTRKPSYSKEIRDELVAVDGSGFLKTMGEWTDARKLYATWVFSLSDYIYEDGRVHHTYNLARNEMGREKGGTVTGRPTCKDPPLQTLPREGPAKRLFISRWRDGGGKLIVADFSQAELRVMADASLDPNMLAIFQKGEVDLHRAIAAIVFGISEEAITKKQRKFTKSVNFGIIYGQTKWGLAKNLKIPLDEASDFLDMWFGRFPVVRKYLKGQVKLIIKDQLVRTKFGRVRHLPGANGRSEFGKRLLRMGLNSPIQATASDICVFCMWCLWVLFNRRKLKSKICGNIYDAVIVDVHPDEIGEVAYLIDRVFNHPPLKKFYGFELAVPLKIEIGIGDNLLDQEGYGEWKTHAQEVTHE